MCIVDHFIFGRRRKRKTVRINFNGRPIDALKGEPIAAALIASGMRAFRGTKRFHHPRGVFCALGRCTDCVMVVAPEFPTSGHASQRMGDMSWQPFTTFVRR